MALTGIDIKTFKIMRKIVGAIVLGIMLSTFAYAQDRPQHRWDTSPKERTERVVAHLTRTLDLTEQQQVDIRAFHQQQMEEAQTAMAEAETRQARHEIRHTQRQLMDEKLSTLLTKAQLEEYEMMKENRKHKRKGAARGNRNE